MSTKAERVAAAIKIVEDLAALDNLTALVPLQVRAQALVHDMKTATFGFTPELRSKSIGSRQAAAEDNYERLFPIFRELMAKNTSYQGIQDYLNANAVSSHTGKPWRKGMVWHMVKTIRARDAEAKAV